MKKPILVTRSSLPPMEEYIDEIRDIWDSHWLTNMGEKHQALQEGLKNIWAWSALICLLTDIWHWNCLCRH